LIIIFYICASTVYVQLLYTKIVHIRKIFAYLPYMRNFLICEYLPYMYIFYVCVSTVYVQLPYMKILHIQKICTYLLYMRNFSICTYLSGICATFVCTHNLHVCETLVYITSIYVHQPYKEVTWELHWLHGSNDWAYRDQAIFFQGNRTICMGWCNGGGIRIHWSIYCILRGVLVDWVGDDLHRLRSIINNWHWGLLTYIFYQGFFRHYFFLLLLPFTLLI